MRITILTITGLMVFGAFSAQAQTSPDFQQYSGDVHQLNKDIRNNEGDLRKDEWDAAHDRSDIRRDQTLRSADRAREQRDLRDGDTGGAKYWAKQSKDESAEIRHNRKDVAHSERDIHNDKTRLAKDFKVRNHDVAKRNAARKA